MIGSVAYFGDALITVDGEIRLYVGGPYVPSGALQIAKPDASAQFVGRVVVQAAGASGSGLVIGQQCAAANPGQFCSKPASAQISIETSPAANGETDIQGEIAVSTNDGTETWTLQLESWSNYYLLPAMLAEIAGNYQELLAEFAVDGDTIVGINPDGSLFFQSAHSGCTGNGTLVPHLGGAVNVYDVTLTIEGCREPYAYLDGAFAGLATTTPDSYWDYDVLLRIWLSRDGTTGPAAITMLGELQ